MSQEIGIKLADGSFFPLFTAEGAQRTTLELVTANDQQSRALLSFFKRVSPGDGEASVTSAELEPMGALSIDTLSVAAAGGATIRLEVECDGSRCRARATDVGSGAFQENSFSVLERSSGDATPDEQPAAQIEHVSSFPEDEGGDGSTLTRRRRILLAVCAFLILLGGVLVGWVLYMHGASRPAVVPSQKVELPRSSAHVAARELERTAVEARVVDLPSETALPETHKEKDVPPASPGAETATSAAAEPVEESGSGSVKVVRYTVKRGDTLWDLARSYYKTPWRYMRIAEFNRLKNPDHIVAGTSIEIPSR